MVDSFEQWFLIVSTPLYALLIGGEILLSHWHGRRLYTVGDTASNVFLMLSNMAVDYAMRGVTLFVLVFFYPYHLVSIQTVWLYWLLLFLAEDFIFYWLHRIDHEVRLFWAVHVTHHSSEHFNLTTGFRSSVFQPVYRFVWFIPLVLLGFRPFDIFIMYAVTQIYGILVHTQWVGRLGVLEQVLVTPSHHRVHHASNVEYLDKNMGMVLIVWDKLFGTFAEERPDIPITFGLYQKTIARDPLTVVFHEWRDLWHDLQRPLPWRHRLQYLLRPPGWSHDGSTQTSEQLRAERERLTKGIVEKRS